MAGLGFTLQDLRAKSDFEMTLLTLSPDPCLTLQDTMWLLSAMPAPVLKGRYTTASSAMLVPVIKGAGGPGSH